MTAFSPTILAIVFLLAGCQAYGASEEKNLLGGGVSYVYFNNKHPSIASETVPVWYVSMGSRLENAGMEFVFSGARLAGESDATAAPDYPSEEVKYFALDGNIKYYFRDAMEKRFTPWLSLGWGVHFFGLENYYYPTYGYQLVLGAGADLPLYRSCFIRGGIRTSFYFTEDPWLNDVYSGTTAGVDLALIWLFDQPTPGDRPL